MQVLILRTGRGFPVIPTLLPRTRHPGAQVLTNLLVMFCSGPIWGPSCTFFDYPPGPGCCPWPLHSHHILTRPAFLLTPAAPQASPSRVHHQVKVQGGKPRALTSLLPASSQLLRGCSGLVLADLSLHRGWGLPLQRLHPTALAWPQPANPKLGPFEPGLGFLGRKEGPDRSRLFPGAPFSVHSTQLA